MDKLHKINIIRGIHKSMKKTVSKATTRNEFDDTQQMQQTHKEQIKILEHF